MVTRNPEVSEGRMTKGSVADERMLAPLDMANTGTQRVSAKNCTVKYSAAHWRPTPPLDELDPLTRYVFFTQVEKP